MTKAVFKFVCTKAEEYKAMKAYTREECEALAEAGEVKKFSFETAAEMEDIMDDILFEESYYNTLRIFL